MVLYLQQRKKSLMVNLLQCNTGKVHGHEGDWKVREVEYERERERANWMKNQDNNCINPIDFLLKLIGSSGIESVANRKRNRRHRQR